jgi:selenocysteine lyase/cysteine desulfurase
VVAFPWACNGVGTTIDVARVVDLAHRAGAIAWIDATHFAVHGAIDVRAIDSDVLLCSAYKFFGPHLGVFYARRELLERWHPYKVRPAASEPLGHRFETGTLPHESLAGFIAAVDYIHSVGWDGIVAHERDLGERFIAGLPPGYRLHGVPTMRQRVATFAVTLPGRTPQEIAQLMAERDIAVWAGHYYAVEVMRRLNLENGAVRIGFVHYNTSDEVDRALAGLEQVAHAARS